MKSALKFIPELNLFFRANEYGEMRYWQYVQFLPELRDLTVPDKILQGVPGEEWQFKYHSIFLKQTITLPRTSSRSHCLFYFSEEQQLGKKKSISADNDFSPLRRYIFRRLNVFIKNVNGYWQKQALST